MRTDHAITRPSSEPASMRPIVDRQTPVKTLPSLAFGNYNSRTNLGKLPISVTLYIISIYEIGRLIQAQESVTFL